MRPVVPYLLAAAIAVVAFVIVWLARRAGPADDLLAGDVFFRCREGHLFRRAPLRSFEATRAGMAGRFQVCPVDGRLTWITPIRADELACWEQLDAARDRDGHEP